MTLPTTTTAPRPLPWQARLPFFYGWVIVGSSFVIGAVSTSVQLWALSVFVVPMQADLGWSRSAIYFPLALRALIAAVGAPFLGKYFDAAWGAVILITSGALISTVGLVLIAGVQFPWQFLVLYGVLGGFANLGQGQGVAAVLVPKWFIRQRGRAVALATMGNAVAAFLTPALITYLINAHGWRNAWVVLGIGSLVLTLPAALVLRRRPEDIGLLPDNGAVAAGGGRAGASERSLTVREATRTRALWLLTAAQALGNLALLGLPSSLVPLYIAKGFSKETAAFGLTVYGLCSMAARFGWGTLAERTHVRIAMIALGLYSAAVLLLLTLPFGNLAVLLGAAALTGFNMGGLLVLSPLVWPAYFGRHHLGAITGLTRPVVAVATAAGPLLLSFIFDQTGSYRWGLLTLAAAWALSSVVMYICHPPRAAAHPSS